ncbi:hypothetical protein [Cryobacterium adonitolivorans]|uniref:hypothetical protein n=1 Tax=Cryobacterium adonitolivorans TaxID=1259189 RepID=UPI003B9798AD
MVIGVNIGGVGVLTLASLMGLVISRRLGLRAKLMAASDSNPSRIHMGPVVLAATMFMGRVGTVTLAAALAASQSRQLFRRPEERPMVG